MKITLTRVLALFTLFGFFATNCSCDDEGCPGSYTSWVKSDPEAIIFVYGIKYGDDLVYHVYPEDANAPLEVHELQPNRDNDSLGINLKNRFTEVRLSNGWSDFHSRVRALVDITYESEELQCPEQPNGDGSYYYVITNYDSIDVSKCTTPPTFSHLVLTDIRDATPGTFRFPFTDPEFAVKSKDWEITSLTDDQGQDLTTDPDWECFSDNSYTFTKDGRAVYYPGQKFCDQEDPDRFGYNGTLTFRYSVTAENPENHSNPGEIKIILHAEGYVEGITNVEFIVTNSSFTEVSGTVTNDGRTANFVIQPR